MIFLIASWSCFTAALVVGLVGFILTFNERLYKKQIYVTYVLIGLAMGGYLCITLFIINYLRGFPE